MASDFTVIQAVRQRFGEEDSDPSEIRLEQETPFVGVSKDFPFSCPNVERGEMAILQFETLGASAGYRERPRNILRINGIDIPGGITPGPAIDTSDVEGAGGDSLPIWKSHLLLVEANVLNEANVLHIESVPIPYGGDQTLDNFILDNVVIFFKVRGPLVDPSDFGRAHDRASSSD
jgi:hypothetical protein